MKKILVLVCVILLCGCNSPLSIAEKDVSFSADKLSQKVVIYNNVTFIEDSRIIAIETDSGEIIIKRIPATIIPDSVYVELEEGGDGFSIISQEFDSKIVSKDALLKEYLGKQVSIINFNEYQDRKEVVEAELLSGENGGIYRINDEVYLGYPGYVILSSVPEGYISEPQLKWDYLSKSLGEKKIKLSYLSTGLSWSAAYVMKIDTSGKTMDLACWANISNNSGATFNDADVRLVAGELNTIPQPKAAAFLRSSMAGAEAGSLPSEEVFEYHMYTIPHKVTLGDRSVKQVMLMEAGSVSVDKRYVVKIVRNYYQRYDDVYTDVPVKAVIKTENSKDMGLGEALPSGKVRLYERNENGEVFFIGEDTLRDTPLDEEIELEAGNVFDVICKTRQIDFSQISKNLKELSWEIKAINHKNESVSVDVIETITGNWEIISNDHDYEKISATKIKFKLDLKAGEEKVITYTVRVGI